MCKHGPLFNQSSGLGGHFQFLEPEVDCLLPSVTLDTSRSRQAHGLKYWQAVTMVTNLRGPVTALVARCGGGLLAGTPVPGALSFVFWSPRYPPSSISPHLLRSRFPVEPPSLALSLVLRFSIIFPPALTPLRWPSTGYNVPSLLWVDLHTLTVTEQAEQHVTGSAVPTTHWNWARLSLQQVGEPGEGRGSQMWTAG